MTRLSTPAPDAASPRWSRIANLVGGWALVVVGLALIPLPGPGWLIVGIGLLVLGREVRWARGAVARLERFMRRHGLRTSLRRLIARRQRERARWKRLRRPRRPAPGRPSVRPMDSH